MLEAVSTSAALELRLSGKAVYDTNQNITWIADANLAASNTFGLEVGVDLGSLSGINTSGGSYIYSDGRMNWGGAMTWISAMNANNYLVIMIGDYLQRNNPICAQENGKVIV